MQRPGESNPWASMWMNKGECCHSWALHQPWPKEPPASDLLARLRQPLPLSPRCCHPGCKIRSGADMKSTCHHKRHCHRRASATPRHCYESASLSITQMRVNTNLFSCHKRHCEGMRACLRCYHETTSASMPRHCKVWPGVMSQTAPLTQFFPSYSVFSFRFHP